MKILVDTHIFLWAITDDPKLSAVHRDFYLDDTNDLYLSIASIWEMLIKTGLGKLPLPSPATPYIAKQMQENHLTILSIRVPHMAALESLPPVHRDPFDRMLIAQAAAEGMPILSADSNFRSYGIQVL